MSELKELAAALAAAQGEIKPAPKDAANPYFKSRYASLPAVREAMQSAFARNGLSVIQMPEVSEGRLRLRTLLLHSSGQSLDCGVLAAEVELDNPQKMGSAITYFRRYALAAISQTVADDDDDGNAATRRTDNGKSRASERTMSPEDMETVRSAKKAMGDAESIEELDRFATENLQDIPEQIKELLKPVYITRRKELS